MSDPNSKTCPACGAAIDAGATGACPHCLMLAAMQPTEQPGADAAPKAAPFTPEQLAPHFPQLEILECLGRGGMGVVYKARQKTLNRLVALKLLAPERVTDPKFAERFAREAQALAALNHPSIVTIYDFGKVTLDPASQLSTLNAQPLFFLLMEFVDGVNLRQAMRAGRFTPEQALAVVPPVCEALQYAHEHGIVHRDIKPENLLLDKDGRVKIADFGIAKMLGEESDTGVPPVSTEATGGTPVPHSIDAGTPQYMAPEQRDHQRTDHRADIYSLGVVLYEMLTGELPADKLEPPSRKVQIDVRLDEIVLRALERTPELRYQTAAEFRTQVETMVAPVPPVGRERRETFTWNAGALFGSALGMSIWMPVAALLSDWNAAGIVLSFTSTGVIVGTALWLWNARHRRPAIEGYLLLLAAGFIATFVFLVGAQSLGLTLRSSVPGGITVSPMNFGWTLGLYFLMWWWFMRRYEEPESPAASGSGSPHGRGSGEVQHRESPHSPQTPPRMSRTAIVGVCWAAFAALAFMALFPLWSMTAPLGSPTVHPSGLLKFILAVVGVVAAAAPFGTTILGWVATSQIRQSAGRLRGMGLAVFDGLVFPLLVLDGFIIWLARTLTRLLVDFYANEAMHQRALADPEHIHLPFVTRLANDLLHSGPSTALFMVATGIAVLVVDFLIIRAVWRAVNGTASAATPRPPQQPESQSRWQGWDVWVIGLSLTAFGALWLDRLSRAQLYRPFQSLDIVLPSALATVIVLAGAAFLWMLAKNLKSTSGSRFTSWRRLSGQAIVPTIAIVILLRAWVLQAFVIPVNSMAPELPAGSRVLVWKLTRQFAPGDIIAHKHGDLVWVSRVVREEKEQLVLQRNEWPEEKLPRADVIGKVISVLWRGSGAVDRSRYPKAETISGANGTVLVHHDNVDLHYALFHANGAWSTVADSQNTHSLLWMETGSMRIAKGRTFSYLRKSLSPDSLNVNGEDFDLRKGRVLVLHDDGTLDQLDIAVTLSVARNPVALGAVIEGMSDAANGRLPAAQTQMRSAIVSTLELGADGKPLPLTTIAFMKAGQPFGEGSAGVLTKGVTDENGFAPSFNAPLDGEWEVVVVRDGVEAMRSAPVTTQVPAGGESDAPNYFLELQAGGGSQMGVKLTPLSLDANRGAGDGAGSEEIGYRATMATLLQRLAYLRANPDQDGAKKGAAWVPGMGLAAVPKRVEVLTQIDRLRRLIRKSESDHEAERATPTKP